MELKDIVKEHLVNEKEQQRLKNEAILKKRQ